MSNLKSCPFCCGEAEIKRMGSNKQSMIIKCEDCGATIETGEIFVSPSMTWNIRAISPDTVNNKRELIDMFCDSLGGLFDVEWKKRDELIDIFLKGNFGESL